MSALAKAIKAFCVPRLTRNVCGDGRVEKYMECPAGGCYEGGVTKKGFKHKSYCPMSLLKRLGDTEKLHKKIALEAYYLDYDGGGICCCPICAGTTSFQGTSPRHRKNCPGAVAYKTAPKKWFLEPVARA